MHAVDLRSLELEEMASENDPDARVRFTFPTHAALGAAASAVVYFEVAPGEYLPTHSDSAEEIILVLEGTGEAWAGDETAELREGQYALVPSNVPHGIRNTGEGPLRVIGFFAGNAVVSVFEEAPAPGAPQVVVHGGRTPIFASLEASTLPV